MDGILLITVVAVALVALIIFLIVKNRKDEKEWEDQLKNDYHKDRIHDTDTGEKERI